MENKPIQVPRDSNLGNERVTIELEAYLEKVFTDHPDETFHHKELLALARRKLGGQYGWDLEAHVGWALDKFLFNNEIKRVAPGTFESIYGPDEAYSERETGHAGPGEKASRGYNVTTKDALRRFKNKKEFNAELSKTEVSAKMLKNMGWNEQRVKDELEKSGNFDPTVLKITLKKLFKNAEVQ